jgi:PAS domain S-box-containing protein
LSSTSVARLGGLLAVLALALSACFVWYEQREIIRRELQAGELLARVLEDHASRTFDTVSIAMSALAETVGPTAGGPADTARLGQSLALAQQGLPFLRSLSLIDGRGRVLASSVRDNVGVVIDLRRIPLPAAGSIERLGTLVAGRDLADAASGRQVPSFERSFLPLAYAVSTQPERRLYLIAVLNPDYFANQQQLMLADPGRAAALLGVDGVLLAATEGIRMAPGQSAASHLFLTRFLPRQESGSTIGPGIDGDEVVTAFRMLRKRPISVIVERSYGSVYAEILRVAGGVALACGAVLAVLGTMIGLAWRSLRSHEAVRGALEATRQNVVNSEINLRLLVESVQEMIFRTDAEGRITFVNGRWSQISGRSADAALGRRLADICLPSQREQVETLFSAGASAATDPVMVQIMTTHGEVRTLEVSVAAVRSEAGAVSGFAGFAVDVSERQSARHKLRSQLDFTARLLEVSPTPIFVKDAQGRFITVNHAWLDLMALKTSAVIGRTSEELYGVDGPVHSAIDERLMRTESRIRYENRLRRPDGETRDTVVTKVRFNQADGSPAGIVGSIIDITEFRQAERSIREGRDAAERANRAKSEFIANINHELRTPLQAINGFAEMGVEFTAKQPELQEMFEDIQKAGRRMLRLVNGLLDVAKLEGSVGSLSLCEHDLAQLVAEVVKELRPLAARSELRVILPATARPWPVEVDAFRLQQVVRNVLANAMRFAPARSAIEIGLDDLGHHGTELTVRDRGPGIPAEELETIFEAFVQSSRTRDGAGGTGLGLTICRKIMGAHGGRIEAGNAEGGGALMRIWLPAGGLRAEGRLTAVDIETAPVELADA